MMPDGLRVSVIVPVYNGAATIRECLESILAAVQQLGSLELIVVDNASTDGTAALLDAYGDRLRVVRETRRGPAAARNAGWRVARGRWLAFTDADCIVEAGWLEQLLSPLERGDADAAGGCILARREAGAVARFGEQIHDHRAAIEDFWPPYLITMNMAIARDLLEELGGFDERWLRGEDSELSFRLAAQGRRFAYVPKAVVRHWNRATIRSLSWEGFVHGYWGAPLYRKFEKLITAPGGQPKASKSAVSSPSIPDWQRGLFSRVFQISKRAGWTAGKWYPPRTLRGATPL